jgi:predicted small lipoprotein YifL
MEGPFGMKPLAGLMMLALAACGVDGEPIPPVDIAVPASDAAKVATR